MTRITLSLGLGVLLGIALAPAAGAQPDPDAAPAAGTVALESGFTPDPHAVDVTAGGDVDASTADAACYGYVAAAPSVVFDNRTDGGAPLHLFVRSSTDTVLLVHTPGGAWLCNDDDEGVSAGLTLDAPERGHYAVWVGTYGGGSGPATLYASAQPPAALDPAAAPVSGTAALATGFAPDPHQMAVEAGGAVWASTVADGCFGFVGTAPAAVLDFDTDGSLPLYVYAQADGSDDLTLIVTAPDGQTYCNDDAEDLNPGLMIEAPAGGRYAVWVGTYSSRARSEEPAHATLSFSETEGPVATYDDFMDDDFMGDGDYVYDGDDISLFAAPAHGTLSLAPGFGSEDVAVEAGGGDAVPVAGAGCAGFIAGDQPDVNVLFGEGGGVLAFSVEADDDATLLVSLPDGGWRCNDDAIGRNPAIVLDAAEAGLYNVWVGTYSQDAAGAPATLHITESDPR